MANIDRFFEALEKEGLYSGRITIAGSEYLFPGNVANHSDPRSASVSTFARVLRCGSLLIILVLVGYVLVNLLIGNGSKPATLPAGNMTGPAPVEVSGQGDEGAETPVETDAGSTSGGRVLAGIAFAPVGSDEYAFSYISQKIFLQKIRSKGSDVRLALNDMIDRVNEEASRISLKALVLTPRSVTNQHLLALWLDGCLDEGQIFLSHKKGAVLVKKINTGFVEFGRISDWDTLSKKGNVFVRIVLIIPGKPLPKKHAFSAVLSPAGFPVPPRAAGTCPRSKKSGGLMS